MSKLRRFTNKEVWNQYKEAAESWAQDPGDMVRKRQLDRVENEILRRFERAAKSPFVR